jgi:hypothetical protein
LYLVAITFTITLLYQAPRAGGWHPDFPFDSFTQTHERGQFARSRQMRIRQVHLERAVGENSDITAVESPMNDTLLHPIEPDLRESRIVSGRA